MDINVKEYQKLRGLSPKSYNKTKKQILKQVSILLNAWVTVQVDVNAENNKKRNTTKESRDIRLIVAKDKRFKNGKLSLWFTPGVVKYLLEYRIPLPSYYQSTKSIIESQLIYYIQNIQNTKKHHRGSKQNPNEFLISTKNLLKATNLPSYEEVMNSSTQCPRRQIIAPLEKALNNLQNKNEAKLYSWEYHKKGKGNEQIPKSLDVKKWDVFQNLNIKIKTLWRPVELSKQLPNGR
ncbi:hypothetical protein [Candidatus Endomicrobiellum agilis]|uniref:hypothetical protein n=1 Tax=Candidatus Endomicrobiellum agilis TaxID=3238957 RepID=UPI003572CBFE|nr:hypothetical protein [Endomicrobium sp.]